MNKANDSEFLEKEKRLYEFMDRNGYDAVLMGTTANFSWLSCGGENKVLIATEYGCCILLVMDGVKYCIANTMDARRLEEQELDGLGFKMVVLRWYDKSIADCALEMVRGKHVLSDMPLPGTICEPKPFYQLHYPLTDCEISRYRKMGSDAEKLLRKVVDSIEKGMSGNDVEALLVSEFAKNSFLTTCMIVGVDDEIWNYRHPQPWDKKIDRQLMLALVFRKYGLNIVLTRMANFGSDIPEETQKRFDAVCRIEAATMEMCRPGAGFCDILSMQKAMYAETGYEEEWKNHFIGGITGYVVNDSSLCMDREAVVQDRQAFNWFVTITGVNVEDTMITKGHEAEILTCTGAWPVKAYTSGIFTVGLPQILVK